MRRGVEAADTHLELHPDDARALCLAATAMVQLGERARSLDWAKRALRIDSEEPTTLYNLGCLYAMHGRNEDAIDCLEKAVGTGFRSF